ncbi:MAG TPA: heavy metal-associated domain-containing protein [Prolixibacteraceae bacterium]|nr:heavy metal-associated domain-containing protein [Prolixibacteraceae bacterium]
MSAKIYLVGGMTCKNCKAHVENGIKEIKGVENVFADHLTGLVSVDGDKVPDEMVKIAVEKSGYIFKGATKPSAPGSDIWVS